MAIGDVNNAANLTADKQAEVNRVMTDAIAIYTAAGQTAPQAMVAMANATDGVTEAMKRLNAATADTTKTTRAVLGLGLEDAMKRGAEAVDAFGRSWYTGELMVAQMPP